MADCDCRSAGLPADIRPHKVVLKTVWSQHFGEHVSIMADRDCPDCGGTGKAPDDLDIRRAIALLEANGFRVEGPRSGILTEV